MVRRFAVVLLLVILVGFTVLVGCNETLPDLATNPNGKPVTGEISGTITFDANASSMGFAATEFVPGEVIVKTEPGLSTQSLSGLNVAGRTLTRVRSLSLSSTGLYRVAGLNAQETLELIATLKARGDVADAVPNYLFYSTRTPNDPLYRNQWHYPAINLPAAWDRTTGSGTVTVAVIDTGILPHPDFGTRLLAGYDFVSDPDTAADGDGRDGNPLDPGPYSKTGYHGTHVAGTIGAASNNSTGVAGVNWAARLLPVRALGPAVTGNGAVGTLADVTDAALWAAGLSVPGVPANPNPADVLNFSLGGNVPCSSVQQEAFDQIFAANKIVVVAAGNTVNGGADAGLFSPANCDGVIVVGASARDGRRASYSNYGLRVSVMAPGGDASDGVLSLGKNDDITYGYSSSAGTSMASPHIAGLASLMKALQPDINQSQVLRALTVSGQTLTDAQCDAGGSNTTLTSRDCGAGLVNAARALEAVSTTPLPEPTPEPTPTPSPTDLARMQVFACPSVAGNQCTPTQQVSVSGQGTSVTYSFKDLPTGQYVIVAWKDVNGNGKQDIGDIEGVYNNAASVIPPASRINFVVTTTTSVSAFQMTE